MSDLIIKQGVTTKRKFTFRNEDTTPFDCSGCVINVKIRKNYTSSETIISASTTGDNPLIKWVNNDPSTGEAWLVIPASITAALPKVADVWVYDAALTLNDGEDGVEATVIKCDGTRAFYTPSAIKAD